MASQTCDVTKIQDEDVLRRMWQETDDFSKKKEIRAHMYKVREQRLKEFYTTGEVARDIQTTSTITTKNRKHAENTHHADSLLDHSFQSLKSKEIRDSESPTKELTFGRTTSAVQHQDRGWNVKESKECSQDGKTQSITRVATTAGSKDIQGGVSNYAAKNEATASVFQDGDENNFKKAVGASNTSVIKQEAHGAEGNTSFHSTSTSSKSSSHFVTEQKSSQPTKTKTTITKTTQGYVPDAVLNDPNTKVYTETKTLADGTKVTTTRYETTGGHKKHVSSSATSVKNSEVKQQHHEQRVQREHVEHQQLLQQQQKQHVEKVEIDNQRRHVEEAKTHQNVQRNENVNVEVRRTEQEQCHREHKQHDVQDVHVERSSETRQTRIRDEHVAPKADNVETVTTVITKTINDQPTEQIRRSSVQTVDRRDSINKTNIVEQQKHFTTAYSTNIVENKRVSVDISPTHDAFVRSLRSVTPERERKSMYPRTSSPEKRTPNRLSPDRKGSQQFGSNETITKSVHTSVHKTDYNTSRTRTTSRSVSPTHYDDKTSKTTTSSKVIERSPTSPTKKSPTSARRPSDECKPATGKTEKVLRRTDTYEERVRQILGIAEKKKAKNEKNVSDIIKSDRNANRKPSLPDVARMPSRASKSKSPEKKLQEYPAQKRRTSEQPDLKTYEKDISPQTNWLPSAPRQTPDRKTPDRKTPDRVTFTAMATAKEIRKYHDGRRTCSPAIDLQDVSDQLEGKRKSPSIGKDDMVVKAFMTAKNGQIYTVDFINVENDMVCKERASPERKSPQRETPERKSPQRETPERKTPKLPSIDQTDEIIQQVKTEVSSVRDSKRTSLTKQSVEDELLEQTTNYIKGDDEDVPASASKSRSPSRSIDEEIVVDINETTKHKTVKKDLAMDVEKRKKQREVEDNVSSIDISSSTTTKKIPMNKRTSSRDVINERTIKDSDQKRTTVTATINLKPVILTTPTTAKTSIQATSGKPKTVGNKNTKPKQRPQDVVKETPKCISTKSIIINEAVAEQREIIVDLKRSKSSREDSPEKVWPIQTEEDSGIPRYPDQIQEPEDWRIKKMKKVNDIIIDEDEHVEHFNRITELVDTEITDVDRVAETDECLLTVNEKVNKFQNEERQGISRKPKGPAPKVTRQEFNVDDTLVSDDCLLSVSDKVHKFKTTAEQLNVEATPERPRSPRCQFNKDGKKVTVDEEKVTIQEYQISDELSKNDECLLSVSEKVIKFVDTAESLKTKASTPKFKTPAASVQAPNETPKTSKKVYLSSVGKLRSTESIKKARELFETTKTETPKPKIKSHDITSRPSGRITTASTKDVKLEDIGIETTRIETEKKHLDNVRRTLTYDEDENVPGYMKQLDRSLRITSPHRDSVLELEAISKGHISHQTTTLSEDQVKTTKFGVTLKRTDSGNKQTNIIERREIATVDVDGTKKEVEDVYDLEILETMLESITNYELRRRIRGQIRIVKKMISEGKLVFTNGHTEQPKRRTSPEKASTTADRYKTVTRKVTTTTSDVVRRDHQRRSPDKVDFKPFRRSPERQLESKMKKDDRPDWAKERILRKASERVQPTTKKSTTTTTATVRKETRKERTSPVKEVHDTDAITSCYGIGPTDENGMPLFGLKALRAHNKSKVQGQVTKSTYYSENGQEPMGEVTVTKYSSDARDLGPGTVQSHGNGISSKTTTQRIGKKPLASIKNVNNKKNDERTTKVTRRNSVKEITQKFIDNNVEATNSERRNTYKAGLILRTSSFKERKSSSREVTPETTSSTSAMKKTGGSFLTNTSKVTGIQDVMSRMKTEEHVEGDTREDAEARQLLNKFLGSQVILAGMEGTSGTASRSSRNVTMSTSATSSTTPANRRTTKVTTTVTENGVPKTNTRTFTHPITQEVLDTVWNEQTLRLLLEQTTEYEERRIIRGRLKQVMAEKEVCSEFMEKTLEESQAGNVHGESLLLPLLQNVLEPPEFEQTADSGTESGEDLRSGLILEVQNALEKLSACLCSDSSDISQERRNSLLQLVSKLQTNLTVPSQSGDGDANGSGGNDNGGVSNERRLSGGRFARRQQRQRHARHTVGVTSEELEDARRLMEEFVLSSSQDNVPALESKLDDQPAFGPVKIHQGVKNSMPKPFANSANTSGTSSIVQTPSNESIELERPEELLHMMPNHDDMNNAERYCYKQSVSFDQEAKPKLLHTYSLDCDQNAELITAVQHAAILKTKPEFHESETDEETLRNDLQIITNPHQSTSPLCQPNQLKDGDTVVLYDQGIYPPPLPPPANIPTYEEPIMLQANPIYAQEIEKSNRFNAKKSRMKRANTIDIPKPSNYYYDDIDSDGDLTEPETSSRRSNYLALRGPIRVGNKGNSSTKVPSFEPKTESDKKFLAFINRQNANSGISNKISLWDKATQQNNDNSGTNWTRKFGNIKTNFERVTTNANPQATSNVANTDSANKNSARNFWKTTENQTPKHFGARNVRQRFEPETISQHSNKNVVAGSLKVEVPHKNYKFVPQSLPSVNKFTHNPHESAFKPIHKTPKPDVIANIKSNGSESSTPETPLYLYSPKSFEVPSPVHTSVPWNNKTNSAPTVPGTGERRVLSLAASKFETSNTNVNEDAKFVPRKLSKEKINAPSSLLQNHKLEKLVAYVPPATKAGGVRKLSGQYDNMDNSRADYIAQSNVKYKSAFAPVPQSRNNTQNCSNFNQNQQHQNLITSSPEKYDKYLLNSNTHQNSNNASNSHDHQHSSTIDIPPSFHTTSPKVQNIQMRHGQHVSSSDSGHAYYNNKQENNHSPVVANDNQMPISNVNYHHQPQAVQTNSNQKAEPIIPTPKEQTPQTHEPHVYYNNVTYQAPAITQPIQNAPHTQRPHYDSQTSTESVHEYVAVSSKVMSGPVSQQAVTVTNKPKSRDEHDMDAAFNLRNALQLKAKSPNASASNYTPKFCVNDEPLSLDTLEVNSRGETIVTGKFEIPAQQASQAKPQQRVSPSLLSKSDSWHQVVQKEQIARKPSPHASPNARTVIKSKSTHALALPKQFEAGMSKDEMQLKKRTMEAYFGQGQSKMSFPQPQLMQAQNSHHNHHHHQHQHHHQPQQQQQPRAAGHSSHKRSVNRVKTTQKISTSTTSEKIVTTKSFNEGPMTQTQVTTRVTSQQQIVKKPMSPFAKFRQMDRQNSLNTPPSTPKTPTSGGPMFKFTDPNLTQSASTIKERLLHWCQMKTKEYDNIKLDNFSTCWADGLAFCALVHHFLPDAFDYTKLTANNRRYNFTLAFQVADEKADIAPLLDVDDMVATRRPDWKCVFTYVQSIYRRFKDQD